MDKRKRGQDGETDILKEMDGERKKSDTWDGKTRSVRSKDKRRAGEGYTHTDDKYGHGSNYSTEVEENERIRRERREKEIKDAEHKRRAEKEAEHRRRQESRRKRDRPVVDLTHPGAGAGDSFY